MTWETRVRVGLLCMVFTSLLGCSLQRAQPNQSSGTPTQSCIILQINDVYRIEGIENGTKGSLARIRHLRRELEREAPVLMMHGGDLLFPSVMSKNFAAKAMVEALNLLDGAPGRHDDRLLVTLGNHEFDEDAQTLLDRFSESEFDWITSNVSYVPEDGEPEPFGNRLDQVHGTRLVEIGGLRIGVFAITLDDYEPDYVSIDYDEQIPQGQQPSIARALKELKEQQPDVLVALTHQTMAMDERLACDVPEIDLIVGGHEHIALESRACDTPIHKADADAISVWIHRLEINAAGELKVASEKRLLDEQVEKDPQMDALSDRWLQRLAEKIPDYNRVYGKTEHELVGLEPLIRSEETAMGNWLTDLGRQRLGTQLSIIHGGSIRINDNIPAGSTIRGEHPAGIFYYSIDMVPTEISGQQLLDMLQHSVANVDRGEGAFLQISGFRFAFRKKANADRGFEVVPGSVEILGERDQWQALDLSRSYSLAIPKYLWSYGYRDGYALFSAGDKANQGSSPALSSQEEVDLRKAVEQALQEEPLVRAQLDGRIRFVE